MELIGMGTQEAHGGFDVDQLGGEAAFPADPVILPTDYFVSSTVTICLPL